jgi:hypothetical protein
MVPGFSATRKQSSTWDFDFARSLRSELDAKPGDSYKAWTRRVCRGVHRFKSSLSNQNHSVTISSEYRATVRIDNNDDCAPASHAGGRGLIPVAPSPKGESVTHVLHTMCHIRLRPVTGSESVRGSFHRQRSPTDLPRVTQPPDVSVRETTSGPAHL